MRERFLKTSLKTVLITIIASFMCFELLGDVDLVLDTLQGYVIMGVLLMSVLVLLALYCARYGADMTMYSFILMLIVSGVVVFMVGFAFQVPLNNIIIAYFVSLPSILILDKLT